MKVLVADDQSEVGMALAALLDANGLQSVVVSSPAQVLATVEREEIGVLVQDMNFSRDRTDGAEGIELFNAVRAIDPDLPVILMTAWSSVEAAVSLIKRGANDYLEKPWDNDKILRSVQNLLQMRTMALENLRLRAASRRARDELAHGHDLGGIIYCSDRMHEAVNLAVNVAAADVPVLITGPNGSGKEKIADIIQANSRRAKQPYLKVNTGALPPELIEAEFFGAAAGAYTGATKLRVGRFESASGGTIFLDEIGNLPLSGQAKLLRVLQTGEFERLGSSQTQKADVRIVSATNVDLPGAIRDGTFRQDLLFRLNVIEIRVPPLAARPEDIPLLAQHFLTVLDRGAGRPVPQLGEDAVAALLAHDWSGNVRELSNRIQRALLVAKSTVLTPADLDLQFDGAAAARERPSSRSPIAEPADASPVEQSLLEEALVRSGGIVARAAAELGVSRQTLYRRMERLGIRIERRTRAGDA